MLPVEVVVVVVVLWEVVAATDWFGQCSRRKWSCLSPEKWNLLCVRVRLWLEGKNGRYGDPLAARLGFDLTTRKPRPNVEHVVCVPEHFFSKWNFLTQCGFFLRWIITSFRSVREVIDSIVWEWNKYISHLILFHVSIKFMLLDNTVSILLPK